MKRSSWAERKGSFEEITPLGRMNALKIYNLSYCQTKATTDQAREKKFYVVFSPFHPRRGSFLREIRKVSIVQHQQCYIS